MDSALPIAMAILALTGIIAGYRVAFVLAGCAALFILVSELPIVFFKLIVSRIYANVLSNWLLVAVPMFIFMGLVLEKSGVAERSLKAAQQALGGTPLGMAFSVLVIGVLLAASSGIVGASVVLLALLAMPRLLENGYDKPTACGLIASSGTLAILIPPSIMLIVLGDQLQTPIPSMFSAAIGPGLLLFFLYAAWLLIKSRQLSLPSRSHSASKISVLRLLVDIGPLLILVFCVLGSIMAGIATPTEASGVGALGALFITAIYGRFSLVVTMDAARSTVIATTMVLMVMVGATCFSAVFRGVGGDELIRHGLESLGGGAWVTLAVVMLAIFLLGFVLDWLEITLILMPIFAPVIAGLDFGNGLNADTVLIWFGLLVAVNLQTSFLTPPFGFSLFYLKGALKDEVSTTDIYRGVLPFIALQVTALLLLILFPSIITAFV